MLGMKRKQNDGRGNATLAWTDRFCIVASAEGWLRIQSLQANLSPADLVMLLASLDDPTILSDLTAIVFDLSTVESFSEHQTVVLALFMDFARHAGVPCQIEGLHAQAASAVWLYRRNHELMGIVKKSNNAAAA